MSMEGGTICGSSNMNDFLQSDEQQLSCSSEIMESLWIPSSSFSALQGQNSVINYENVNGVDTKDMPFYQRHDKAVNGDGTATDDDFDGSFHPPGKKRRLTATQVEFLERSFEVENKLDPERKVQLAKELGLQPRQVAIWFQNRRARFKNKQLEKDYDSLKARYDELKADYDNLLKEKDDLKTEVISLKEKLGVGERGMENLESLDAINSSNAGPQKPNSDTSSPEEVPHVPLLVCKQEEACSARSDIFDSDSSHYTDGNHSSFFMEPADSSNVLFEPDHQSDISQDEDDNLSKSLLQHPPILLPKFELDCYYDAPPNSCIFTVPVEDQSFWSLLY